MKKTLFYLLFTFLAYTGYAQESWKTLREQGTAATEKGNYAKADSLLTKALLQAEKEFGKLNSDYANSCNDLAGLYTCYP